MDRKGNRLGILFPCDGIDRAVNFTSNFVWLAPVISQDFFQLTEILYILKTLLVLKFYQQAGRKYAIKLFTFAVCIMYILHSPSVLSLNRKVRTIEKDFFGNVWISENCYRTVISATLDWIQTSARKKEIRQSHPQFVPESKKCQAASAVGLVVRVNGPKKHFFERFL